MIVWTGFGFLVLVISIAIMAAVQLSASAVTGDANYYTDHEWVKGLGLVLAGVAVFAVGRWLNLKPGRRLIDADTGEEIEQRTNHSFFFIPMQYCGIILGGLGVYGGIVGF